MQADDVASLQSNIDSMRGNHIASIINPFYLDPEQRMRIIESQEVQNNNPI